MALWGALLLLLLPSVQCQPSQLPAESYQRQLLAQRDAISNWEEFSAANNLTGWQDDLGAFGAVPVCGWTGVGCNPFDGSVTKLNLTCTSCDMKAQGTLAPELAEISSLQELYFSNQSLSGALPDAWGGLGQFASLTTLLVDLNKLNGTLPQAWGAQGAFPRLQNMKLSGNLLSGPLPGSWGNNGSLPALQQLYLEDNTLTGNLPSSWGRAGAFPNLKALSLANLDTGFNTFPGTLPASWGSVGAFPALTDLNLVATMVTGTLPAGWGDAGAFPKLFLLELGGNQLTGPLPVAWAREDSLPDLGLLSLSGNLLSGSIPAVWGSAVSFPNIGAMALGDTALCGPVPPSLFSAVCEAPAPFGTNCVGTELQACTADFPPATAEDVAALLAQKNAITNWDEFAAGLGLVGWTVSDPVCSWSGVECTENGAIIRIDLSCPSAADALEFTDTGLYAAAPGPAVDGAGSLPQCVERANGTLAAELAGIRALQAVTFTNLGLSGPLPDAWGSDGSFENLNELYLDSNSLTGTLPSSWATQGAFPRLLSMSMVNNTLTGPLPTSWGTEGSFPALRDLLLEGNDLTGPLPESFGLPDALPALRSLYFSNNSIGGTLPEQWGQNGSFARLVELYLGNNGLTGVLPDSWGSAGAFSDLTVLDLRNNDLSGAIPAAWNASDALPSIDQIFVSGNEDLCGAVPANMLKPVCGDDRQAQCTSGNELECAASTPPPPTSPSSSTNVGAIVGGVVGGLVAAALLAFLAIRCLRRRAAAGSASADKAESVGGKMLGSVASKGSEEGSFDQEKGMALVPPAPADGLSLLGPGPHAEQQGEQLPFSYVTTAGHGKQYHLAGGSAYASSSEQAKSPSGVLPSHQSASLPSLDSDPTLSFISTRLATLRQRHPHPATLSPASSTGLTASSGPLPLEVQQWEVQWEQIQLERSIGRGSFGKVYLAHWNATPVAVKILINAEGVEQSPDLELPDDVMRQLQEEAVVMSRMRHPNLVSFMGLCTLPPCILTEYCSRGSLYDVLRQASWQPERAAELTWRRRLSMAFDAARGLLYLHLRTPPIIHRDVKSPNLLVDQHWNVKVCDFNLSEILRLQPAAVPMGGDASNPTWLAPEVLRGTRPTPASDVYSFGIVLWELLAWKLPWARKPPYQVRRDVLEGRRPEVPAREALPGPDGATFGQLDAYCQLMRDCWAQAPAERPTFADIVPRLGSMLEEEGSV